MLTQFSPRQASVLIGVIALVIICGAWIFEYAGYAPCELCLAQRWAYYGGIPAAALIAFWNPPWIKGALWLMALLWLGSAVFGAYHSGVEWGWWQGPTTCSGGDTLFGETPFDPDQMTKKLGQMAVRCNEAAIRILWLSLAGWNAVISTVLALIAAGGAIRNS